MARRLTMLLETPTAAMSRLRAKIRTDYAEKALEALSEVVQDRKAPAPARATAGTTLLRAAGFFEKVAKEDDEGPLHDRTPAELDRMLADTLARLEQLKTQSHELTAEDLDATEPRDAEDDEADSGDPEDDAEEDEGDVFT